MPKKILTVFLPVMLLLSVFIPCTAAAAFVKYPMNYVYEEGKNQSAGDESGKIYIPVTYSTEQNFSYIKDETPNLTDPEDLFIDSKNNMYIADTGNNRIVVLSPAGETLAVFYGPSNSNFSSPRGVFVSEAGEIYVADSGNSRIVKMDSEGKLIAEFTRPESELLTTMESFDPSKLAVGPTGYIYILVGKEFMAIDQNNKFKGFVGATDVGFSLSQTLIRMFATKEQKTKVARRIPPAYNNFLVDSQGRFIACSGAKNDQIRIINSVGKNIYKSAFYGEITEIDEQNRPVLPSFADIAVNKSGTISALDKNSGKIYQYDEEGNLLTVFAGLGDNKGYFKDPSSIACDSNGNLYVLDKSRGNIQKFEPTLFIDEIHTALELYYKGNYESSLALWKEIVKINSDYPLARKLIGSIEYKQQRYAESVEEYKLADDMGGYSRAFSKLRHQIFRKSFTVSALLLLILGILSVLAIIRLKRLADRILLKTYERRRNLK